MAKYTGLFLHDFRDQYQMEAGAGCWSMVGPWPTVCGTSVISLEVVTWVACGLRDPVHLGPIVLR